MKTTAHAKPGKEKASDAPFYLIFDSVTDAQSGDATVQELDEITQIRQMILESTEEAPLFLTCT